MDLDLLKRPETTHATDLRPLAERLEAARVLIEERFLKGGAALMSAFDIVSGLMDSLEGVTGALGDTADEAAANLISTMAGMQALVASEGATRSQLAGVLADARAIPPLIREMQGQLRYLATCAIETRIAGAGIPEFAGFADDVANYVANASEQVGIFSVRVNELAAQLSLACEDHGTIGIAEKAPATARLLQEAADGVRQRGRDLAKLAQRAEVVARGVQGKVSSALSALQIGDVTRQRIEHVHAGIAMLSEALAEPALAEPANGYEVGRHLLSAQTSSLTHDFVVQTRAIVSNIEGFAVEASRIVELTRSARSDGADPMKAIEHGVSMARGLVRDIEEAGHKATGAYVATKKVANELLSNMGSIGNLRNVRDDIRCLAINAYLRSNRLGPKGRAVGVIAAEMNTYAARLGVAAEGILSRLAAMQQAAAAIDASGEAPEGLVGQIDAAAAALRQASQLTDRHMLEVTRNSDAVADRIGRIAGEVDFRHGLGEALEDCCKMFGPGAVFARTGGFDARLKDFSIQLYRVYTMASERDIHRDILPLGLEEVAQSTKVNKAIDDDDNFDDALF
ncbi:hypothetical protein [Oryzibacter oryziterrae]|uniref:hypothetical protein n=1 Tax=Oryzibacter oryziterrae TaxID=2766474 RepID=UPI001F18CA40|nr:hypothetical protein [Oryzibacter oryziterrae]